MWPKVEVACGAIAAVNGLAVVAFGLSSLGTVWWYALLVFVGSVGVALGAYKHAHEVKKTWLVVLWASFVVLLICSLLTLGVYLLPAVALGLAGCVIGSFRALQSQ